MLSYPESRTQLEQIFKLINSGRYYSLTFMKLNGAIRFLNGHKAYYKPKDGPQQEIPVAKPTQLEQGILLVWDRNAVNYKTGLKGDYRKSKLENIMFIKSGQDVLDFMEENDIQKRFNLSDQQIVDAKKNMKIDSLDEKFKIFEDDALGSRAKIDPLKGKVYSIGQLDPLFAAYGNEPEIIKAIKYILAKEFRRGGDQAVVDAVREYTGHVLTPMSLGRYMME